MSLEFKRIFHKKSIGKFVFEPTMMKYQPFRGEMTNVELDFTEVTQFQWIFSTNGCVLRLWKSDEFIDFPGFKGESFKEIHTGIKEMYNKTLEKIPLSFNGYNWGDMNFSQMGNILYFSGIEKNGSGNRILEIPLDNIKNCTKSRKANDNSMAIEFHQDPNEPATSDCLSEIHFAFPSERKTELTNITSEISQRAGVVIDESSALTSFSEQLVVAPRGRYSIDIFKKFVRLHGKTYDFKIMYAQISTMFLLDQPDDQEYFVIALNTPIRTGKTDHFYLVLSFDKSKAFGASNPVKVNMKSLNDKEKKELKKKGISEEMNGKCFEVIAKIIRGFSRKKLIGSGSFTTTDNQKGVKCSHKANEGILYFLEKSILFLHKPTMYYRHEEIVSCKIDTQGQENLRFFALDVVLKGSKKLTFSNIEKGEHENILRFLRAKGLRVDSTEVGTTQNRGMNQRFDLGGDDDEDEEDEDFDGGHVSEDDDEEFEKYVDKSVGIQLSGSKRSRDEGDEDEPDAKR